MTTIECAYCGEAAEKPAGHVNRARKMGNAVYCSRTCSGLGRRKNKSDAEKREAKRLYDIDYRRKNAALLKAKKAEYFQRTYDPEKARVARRKRAKAHAEYCRQPEYREWKRGYDRQYRARKEYGEYADCFLLVMDIRDECLRQHTDYEIRQAKGTLNKRQERKRNDERTHSQKLEVGSLGNLERSQGGQNGGLASGLRSLSGA